MPVKTSIIDPAPSKFSQNSVCPKLSKQLIIQQTVKVTLHYVALNFVRIEYVVPCLSLLSSGHCDSFRKESHKKNGQEGRYIWPQNAIRFHLSWASKGHFHPFLTLCCFGYLAVFGWASNNDKEKMHFQPLYNYKKCFEYQWNIMKGKITTKTATIKRQQQ